MATVEETTIRECPFLCGKTFFGNDWYEYQVTLHIEEEHTENSEFVVREDGDPSEGKEGNAEHSRPRTTNSKEVDNDSIGSEEEKDEYVLCPEEGCGEMVLLIDFTDHLDLHQAENVVIDDSASCDSATTNATETSLAGHGSDNSTSTSPPRYTDASSGSASAPLAPIQLNDENFSTTKPPTLHRTSNKSKSNTSHQNRRRLSRPFTKFVIRPASKQPNHPKKDADGREKRDKIKRLGVSTLWPS